MTAQEVPRVEWVPGQTAMPVPGVKRHGSLFSGYEGLGLALEEVLGSELAWVSDIDPGACRILAHRWPDVPNLGDISEIDWEAVEDVDVLSGGFPCQDVSAAGKRLGMKPGTRSGLWAQMAYGIAQLRPPLVVIENVRGLLSAQAGGELEPCPWCVGDDEGHALRALGGVLGDLAGLGYDARWIGLRAADVGAPHGRFRVFVVAWPAQDADVAAGGQRRVAAPGQAEGGRARADAGRRGGAPVADAGVLGRLGWSGVDRARRHPSVGGEACGDSGDRSAPRHAAADADRDRREGVTGASSRRDGVRADERDNADGRDRDAAADTDGQRGERRGEHGVLVGPRPAGEGRKGERQRDGDAADHRGAAAGWGPYADAVARWEQLTRPAPAPTEPGSKGQPRLSPAFVEWMMGLPLGHVTAVPGLSRNEQLKALGNGVVPQQAAAALRLLLAAVGSTA